MTLADSSEAKKPHIVVPDDFEDEAAFLEDMRQRFTAGVEWDKENREAGIEDLKFLVGDQWDEDTRNRRQAARKPVLTVNRLPAFVAQIVGARRLNETTIKVVPDNGGTQPIARIREGLMRSIQKDSRADIAYDKALENSVACGIGNFQIETDYESDDVFEQCSRISPIPDAFAVVWDPASTEPTGRDAGFVFVVDTMTRKEFARQWPWAQPSDLMVDAALASDVSGNGWVTKDDVRVVRYWRIRTRVRTLALMQDGKVEDVTESGHEALANVMQRADGTPILREVDRKYAEMYIASGTDLLEGPYELPISRVPAFRVPAWEIFIGQTRHRWGLVRFLKDPQRLHNYWRSIIAERLTQSPRAVWLAPDVAVQGREKQFRESHLSDDPLLVYSAEAGTPPQRVPPAQLESALLEQAELANQDIKDVSNIHEANLGMPSNEVSGAAIVARQRVSDTGTIIYHDNLALAMEECGRTLNELIPYIYDTPRIITVLGEDGKQDLVLINKEDAAGSVDIAEGKYKVSVTTGPSFLTKRLEAAAHMENLINAMPQVAATIADLLVEAQDWPKAEEIARRLRMQLPPGIVDQKDMTPEQQAAAQAAQEQQQDAQALQRAGAVADISKKQSEAAVNAARARNFVVNAETAERRANTDAMSAASQASDRELRGHLEAIRVADGK